MSGHSKWSTIKRKKGALDAKRGVVFTKLANLITIMAKKHGSDPDTNFSLRMAIEKAKSVNMPKNNIERAIKRGSGEIDGEQIEELIYECVGPANSQFIIKALTDNKNRSAANIRHIFTKAGGSLGSVMWNFEQKGVIVVANEELKNKKIIIDNFEMELIDAGAEDITNENENKIIYTKIENLQNIKKFLDNKNIKIESAEIEYIAKEKININDNNKNKIEKLINDIENCEDIADYYINIKNI